MTVDRRLIVAPNDRERTAVVTIALPAGGEVEIDPLWRFTGWLAASGPTRDGAIELMQVERPQRIDVDATA